MYAHKNITDNGTHARAWVNTHMHKHIQFYIEILHLPAKHMHIVYFTLKTTDIHTQFILHRSSQHTHTHVTHTALFYMEIHNTHKLYNIITHTHTHIYISFIVELKAFCF